MLLGRKNTYRNDSAALSIFANFYLFSFAFVYLHTVRSEHPDAADIVLYVSRSNDIDTYERLNLMSL